MTVSALTAMRFAIRGREVDVPLLTGKTPEQAKQILDGLQLKLKVSSSLFSSQVAEGKVGARGRRQAGGGVGR